MDNSGRGPLRVPGFGGIPVDFELPITERFADGYLEWRQSPPITAQELAMVALMEWLTDKPSWFEDVSDDTIVAQWRAELEHERLRFTRRNPRLLRGDKTWDWCVKELRDKARDFKKKHHVRVLDTGSCVIKVDPAELASSSAVLRRAFLSTKPEAAAKPDVPVRSPERDGPYDKTDNPMDPDYYSHRGWKPAHGGDRDGCAYMISALVDPLMFPLVYGRTRVLQQGGAVALDNMLESYAAAQEAPIRRGRSRSSATSSQSDGCTSLPPVDYSSRSDHWSDRYQSIPCEAAFGPDDGDTTTDGSENVRVGIKITSYVNGLHPYHTDVYRAIEQVLSRAIRPWNECLVRGHQGLNERENMGQLGPVPARIITYGAVWENEMPEWTTAFRIWPPEHEKCWREVYEQLQHPRDSDREDEGSRLKRLRYVEDFLAKPAAAKELPVRDSDLWQKAREYLEQPEPPMNDNVVKCVDWDIGDEETWDHLTTKAARLVFHKHPEPGAAFTYEEWRDGRHGSRPIVEPVPENERYLDVVIPPHEVYSVALQDIFREQGLQVVIGVKSIDLTPETPAYAPDIVDRDAAFDRWAAKSYGKAKPGEAVTEDMLAWDDDGWQLAGQQLNDHVVGVAVLAFDVENISEPRLEFRQAIPSLSLHRFDGHETPQWAPDCYNYFLDGPARLYGKWRNAEALAETFGLPWMNIDTDQEPYPYQHIGSVGLSQDRLVVFPNVLEHRLSPFRLIDPTKPGRLRWLTLSLVDPNYRVCSTRNVPPQQHTWWAREAGPLLAKAGKLPAEVVNQILEYTSDWPMGSDEASRHRQHMADEGGLPCW